MDPFTFGVWARVVERGIISATVLITALVFMVLMWEKIQKIDVNVGLEKNLVQTNLTFSMPIFLLLVLVGYGFVSFSNEISITSTSNKAVIADTGLPKKDTGGKSGPNKPTGTVPTAEKVVVETGIYSGFGDKPDEMVEILRAMNSLQQVTIETSLLEPKEGFVQVPESLVEELVRVNTTMRKLRFEYWNKISTPEVLNDCQLAGNEETEPCIRLRSIEERL